MQNAIQFNPFGAQYEEARRKRIAGFIEKAASAERVETNDGPAILVGGVVINISSPDAKFHVEALVEALRGSSGEGETSEPSAPLSSGGGSGAAATTARTQLSLGQHFAKCECHDCTQKRPSWQVYLPRTTC